MIDMLHWYARLHGPRAVRVIQTALTEHATAHDEVASPRELDSLQESAAEYGTCSVPDATR